MKPRRPFRALALRPGICLIECLVYIAVFAVLLGIGTAAFYVCWDHSKALHYATDDITAALHAGERWRADVRSATGKITVETTAAGELLRIPCGTNEIIYRFNAGEVRRQIGVIGFSGVAAADGQGSQMMMDVRGAGQRVALGAGIEHRAARKRICRCYSRLKPLPNRTMKIPRFNSFPTSSSKRCAPC